MKRFTRPVISGKPHRSCADFRERFAILGLTEPTPAQVERYARPPANSGSIVWTEEEERKHPRDKGKFASKPGAKAEAEQASGSKPPAAKPTGKVTIGGRAFEILKATVGTFFRINARGPWSKASPAAQKAIDERFSDEALFRQAHERQQQAAWGTVPEAKRIHKHARGLVARMVDSILGSMAAQDQQPSTAEAAKEHEYRQKLERHYVALMRQAEKNLRGALEEHDTARQIVKQIGQKLGRTPRAMEEVSDPETGELLPRHELETRQKAARQKARIESRQQRDAWKQERAAAWKRQLADWQAKRERQEAERKARRAKREADRLAKTATANTPAAQQAQIAQEMKTAKKANNRAAVKGKGTKAMENEAIRAYEKAVKEGKFEGQLPTATITERSPEEIATIKRERRSKRAKAAAEARRERAEHIEQKKQRLYEVAKEQKIDPEHLKAAAEEIAERKFSPEDEEYNAAWRAAVARTGLNEKRISQIENGQDEDIYDLPHMDTLSHEIAGDYPILGMGRATGEASGGEQESHAEQLVDIIKAGPRPQVQWYDCIDEAVDLAESARDDWSQEAGANDDPGELVGAGVGDESFPWENEPFSRRRPLERYRKIREFYRRRLQ